MPAQRSPLLRSAVEGVLLGAAYGLLLRIGAKLASSIGSAFPHQLYFGATVVMTLGFLCFGPAIMGLLVVRRAGVTRQLPVWQWIVLPWISVLLACGATLLIALEGAICIVFAIPIMLVFATLGGVVAGLENRRHLRLSHNTTACLAVLPVLLSLSEPHLLAPIQTRTVHNQIRIHAPTAIIWKNIERVPAIAPTELRPNWAHRIGFPRPVEATLSFEGVGGVRHASFEHGLVFLETVTAWQPGHRIAFTIKADTEHIPPTTLDEHVTIGGRYFDVLDGEYALEPLPNGDTLLHLTSHQRLSTDFNGYAGLWSDAVMSNLQSSILEVIEHRCEHQAQAPIHGLAKVN